MIPPQGMPPQGTPAEMTPAQQAEYRRRQRSRSLVMAIGLGALVVLLFAISLAKIM